jgi:hypothetical protein
VEPGGGGEEVIRPSEALLQAFETLRERLTEELTDPVQQLEALGRVCDARQVALGGQTLYEISGKRIREMQADLGGEEGTPLDRRQDQCKNGRPFDAALEAWFPVTSPSNSDSVHSYPPDDVDGDSFPPSESELVDGRCSPRWQTAGRTSATFMDAEPGRSIIEHLNKMAMAIENYTGLRGITRLSLETEVGLMLGIAPGTSVDVATAAGSVEVYCERSPRFEGTCEVGP